MNIRKMFLLVVGLLASNAYPLLAQQAAQPVGQITAGQAAPEPEEEAFSTEEASEIFGFFSNLSQGNMGAMSPELMEAIQSFIYRYEMEAAQRRAALLEQLPEEVRRGIALLQEKYEDFAVQINCPMLLGRVMARLDKQLEAIELAHGPVVDQEEAAIGCATLGQARARAAVQLRAKLPAALRALKTGGALYGAMQSFNSENPLGSIIKPIGMAEAAQQSGAMVDSLKRQFAAPLLPEPAPEQPSSFAKQDLAALLEAVLEAIRVEGAVAESPEHVSFMEDLRLLQAVLAGVATQDGHAVARAVLEYLRPANKELQVLLCSVDEMLLTLQQPEAAAADQSAEGAVPSVKNLLGAPQPTDPARFWRKELRGYAATLFALDSLLKRVDLTPQEDFNSLFRLLAGAYEVADTLYGFYLKDARAAGISHKSYFRHKLVIPTSLDKRIIIPELVRRSLSTSLAAWYFFNTRNMLDKGQLFDVLFARQPLAQAATPQGLLITQCMSVAMSVPAFIGKPRLLMSRLGLFKQSALKCGLSFLYYHLFYSALFDRNAALNANGLPDMEIVRGEDGQPQRNAAGELIKRPATHKWWPNDNRLFKRHLQRTCFYGAEMLIATIESEIYNAVDPMVSAHLDAFTLGVVKPGALRALWKAFMPMLLLEVPSAVVSFDNWDFYHENIFQDGGNGGKAHEDSRRFTGYSKPWIYAERTLFNYLIASIGGHLGRKVGQHYKAEILSGCDGFVKGLLTVLNKLWLVSDEVLESYNLAKELVKKDYEDILRAVQQLAEELFDKDNQWRRSYIIPLLIEHGYLDSDYAQDETIVNKTIIYSALRVLARFNALTYYEAAKFARSFKKNPQALKGLIDQIVEAIVSNLVAAGTSWAAGGLAGLGADAYYDGHGPFFLSKAAPAAAS